MTLADFYSLSIEDFASLFGNYYFNEGASNSLENAVLYLIGGVIFGLFFLAIVLQISSVQRHRKKSEDRLYQLGLFRRKGEAVNAALLNKIGLVFIISSVLNLSWVIAWHFGQLVLSFIILALLLVALIRIRLYIAAQEPLSKKEKWFVRLPFSVYFGWVTIATIAGATALLVGTGFSGFGISEPVWTMLILLVGAVIGIATALRFRDVAYLAVFIWAYANILSNHVPNGIYAGAYPGVIVTLALSLVTFVAVILALLWKKKTK